MPSREFLEDKNTVYPVFIDPSVNSASGQIADTYITSKYSSNNYVNDENLKVGYSSSLSVSRGLIKLTGFPTVLDGCTITQAYYYAYQNYDGSSSPIMQVAQITSSWEPSNVKWSNRPSLGSVASQITVQAMGWYGWDVTSLVNGWRNTSITNYGMYLKIDNESSSQYKRFYSDNSSTCKNYFAFTYTDATPPPLPESFWVSDTSFSGSTGSITIAWSPVTDLPVGSASGINRYNLVKVLAGDWSFYDIDPDTTSYTFTGCPDNSAYSFGVRAWDNNGNVIGTYTWMGYQTPDCTGPTAPSSFTVSPNSWTSSNPTITWSGISDPGSHLQNGKAKYQVDGGDWIDIGQNYGVGEGSYTIDASTWSDGQHKIRLRGMDSFSNAGTPTSDEFNYKKDTTAPTITIGASNSVLTGIVNIRATVTNSGGSDFANWFLDYGEGNPATSFDDGELKSETSTVNDQVIYEWDTAGLVETHQYTIRLRAYDDAGNCSTATIILLKTSDSQIVIAGLQIDQPYGYDSGDSDGYKPDVDNADQYVISFPSTHVAYQKANDGGVEGLSGGKLYVNNKLHAAEDTAGEGFTFNAAAYNDGWVYPEGSIVFLYTQAKDSANQELYSTPTFETLEIADAFKNTDQIACLDNVELYGQNMMQLTQTAGVFAQSGSFESVTKSFAGDISYIDLTVTQSIPGDAGIVYQVWVDGDTEWRPITPVSADGGATVNPANRKYFITSPTGSSVKIRAILTKSTDNLTPVIDSWSFKVRYTTYANAVLVDNTFPQNARGMTNLIGTYHDKINGNIELSSETYGQVVTGSVESTVRLSSNDVIEACLEVEENVPEGTDILYYISTQAGAAGTWQPITPGAASNLDDWEALSNPGTQVVIKAVLSSNGAGTPELQSWRLSIKEKIGGTPYMVKLVDEPWNLSTLPGANYMTLLRWEESETAEMPETTVVYNVYRSTTPYFVPSPDTLAAEGLTENSWNDYNLNYGQTFYYKVTAVEMIGGHARESLPSNEAEATVVSEDEVTKRLGLQDYWSYSGFQTGSGTGYINVSNGNIVYTTTDIVVSDPFLAMVMRRTFNSMANTKTAMGYGWDFSFNTCLLKEYSGTTEIGMVLKDGDGTFHRFAKNGDVYESAKGTFMNLTYNAELDEYQIKRKDNIVYHFDAQSMKIKSFTDNNDNALTFTYDTRGNLKCVTNTVGDTVELTYHVAGAAPGDPDYTYVNDHSDMLESVKWTENKLTDPATITYSYRHTDSDRLLRGYTTIEGSTTYEEVFSYGPIDDRLIAITDPNGKQTGLSYDAAGRAERITAANDDYYDFTYADLGADQNQTTVTDKCNVSNSYQYDDEGLLYEKTDALGVSINYTHDQSTYLVTGMSYNNNVNGGSSQLISYSYGYTDGNITSITGPSYAAQTTDVAQTTYGAYNSFNKPSSVSVKKSGSQTLTTYYTYDSHGNLLTTTDPEGKVTTNIYGAMLEDTNHSGTDTDDISHFGYLMSVEGDFGNQTRYTYEKGRVVEVKEYDNGTLRTAKTYAYEYNVGNYFLHVTATDVTNNNTSTSTYYNRLGMKVKVEYPNSTYELWNYDLAGNVIYMRNRAGHEVRYSYDNLYRLNGASYPDNTTNSIEYPKWDSDNNASTGDASGNDADKVIKTDGAGGRTIEYYDMAGRLVKTSVSNGSSEIDTAKYEYDEIGNCIQTTDNAGRVSQAQYNELGQKTKTIADPTGENIQNSYTYDLVGNQLSVTDGEGYTTSYTYDNDSRLHDVTQTLNGNSVTTGYTYDIEEDGYIKNRVTDAEGRATETWFDAIGRKVKDYNVGIDGDSTVMQTSYTYNNSSQLYIVTRNDGTKEKYAYNMMGQTTRIDYYEAAENTAADSDDFILYEYNDDGSVHWESVHHDGAPDETTDYEYDGMGRVCQITQGSLQNGGLSVHYTYDGADRVKEISYIKDSTLRKIGYVYDGFGRVHSITLALGNATPRKVREYVYKDNGDLNYIKDYRNFNVNDVDYIKTAYEINGAGLTTKITYTDYTGSSDTNTKKEEYTMAYDDRGYITAETAYTNYDSSAQTVNKSYTYDSIGRMTQAVVGNDTKNYTYDKVGNRLTMSDGTDTYTYHYDTTGFNRLGSITLNDQTVYASYTYDGRGNQTQEQIQKNFNGTTKTQTTDYTYDLLNTLTAVSVSAPGETTQSETNSYNASGQRVKRLENGETTKYYYSGSATLFTTNANNYLLTENIIDLSGNIIASARFDDQNPNNTDYSGQYFFYHYDMRGSTTAIVYPDGNLVKGYSYDTFGQLTQSGDGEDFLNDVTFTGSVTDTSTGLQYMNARYYNPSTGRFLSQDTYSGNPYDPWTQHLYAYSGNNPVNFVDPTGYIFFAIFALVAIIVGTALLSSGCGNQEAQREPTEITVAPTPAVTPSLSNTPATTPATPAPSSSPSTTPAGNLPKKITSFKSSASKEKTKERVAQAIMGEERSSSASYDWQAGQRAVMYEIVNRYDHGAFGGRDLYKVARDGQFAVDDGKKYWNDPTYRVAKEYAVWLADELVEGTYYENVPIPAGFTNKHVWHLSGDIIPNSSTRIDQIKIGGNVFFSKAGDDALRRP